MIYVSGDQSHGHLVNRGKKNHDMHPYNGVWRTDQETFSIALSMFLLIFGIPQSCFEVAMIWCSKQGPDFGYTNDPSRATYKISLTISSWKNGYSCKRKKL
jgi:hypothetical protein